MNIMNLYLIVTNEQLFYSYWNEQYIYLISYFIISFILTFIVLFLGYLLSPKELHFEKTTSYECGFEPFGDSHLVFNIQFFVVGILFMLFDLELAFVFPWVIYFGNLSIFSYYVMVLFLVLLIIGFIYEWKKGALDWV